MTVLLETIMPFHTVLKGMVDSDMLSSVPRCLNCGFEAPHDGGDWNSASVPPLGDLMRCPECGSTNILGRT